MHINRKIKGKLSIVFIAIFFIISLQSQMNDDSVHQSKSIEELLIGKWYGGGVDKDDNDKGYMVFDEEGGAVLIIDGETIGGAGFEIRGTDIQLNYEVDEDNNPAHLDFILSTSGTEVGRMKGIINFSDDDSFKVNISFEPDTPRPTSFDEGDVALFERVKQ